MLQKLILLPLIIVFSQISFAGTKINVIKRVGDSTVSIPYEVEQRTLRDPNLRQMAKNTAAKAMSLIWNDSYRWHESFDDASESQFHIEEQKIELKVVMYMQIKINGTYKASNSGEPATYGKYTCLVDLERYEAGDDLVSEYAICETDKGEEIEYEN